MNKCCFIGNITKDLEIRKPNDTSILSFSIAVNRRFKSEGQPTADFPKFIAFGKTAEFIDKYFEKGKSIAIVARFQSRNWENDEGKKIYVDEFIVEEVGFAGNKNNSNTSSGDNLDQPPNDNEDDEEAPF